MSTQGRQKRAQNSSGVKTGVSKSTRYGLRIYKPLEARIKKNDLDALVARWEFGRKLLEDKASRKHGEWMQVRQQISNTLEISTAEISNRMQFAEQYSTQAKVRAVFKKYGSWYEICQSGLGKRNATPGGEPEGDLPPRAVGEYTRAADLFLTAAQKAVEDAATFRKFAPMIRPRHEEIRRAMETFEQSLGRDTRVAAD